MTSEKKALLLTLTCYDMVFDSQMFLFILSVDLFFWTWLGCVKFQVTEVLTSLREISKLDTEVAHQLWVTLFPLLWSNLQVEERERLRDSIVTLLARDWHYVQRHQRPNVVNTLLQSISMCQPLPRLPGLLVSFLGRKYGACQIASSILGSSLPNHPEVRNYMAT